MTRQADDRIDADPGLARERTHLAWTRTAISFAALGVVFLKIQPVAGILVMAFSAAIWRLGRLPRAAAGSRSTARRVLLTTLAVTAMALIALVIALLGHGSSGVRL